jgi:Skp family chaperone for outer membrane proteins
MTKLYFTISAILLLAAASAVTQAQVSPLPKIAFINSEAFYDEKLGISKLVNAIKQLEREFEPKNQELTGINNRLAAIATELQNMQKLPTQQFNQAAFNAKREEGERLKREFDYKKTEAENAVAKRRRELVGPVSQEIGNAIDDYAKKNGYTVIIDPSKLSEAMLHYNESADSTKDFITFFNARVVARPAAAAAPKP